jgi:hypothetical protein
MILKKIKDFKNINKSKVISFTIISLILIFTAIYITNNNFIVAKKINQFYYSWIEFGRLSGQDVHDMWSEKYYYAEYKLNGNGKENKYDCSSSIFFFLKDLGSNAPFQKVEQTYKTLNIVSRQRVKQSDVKEKDLIILQINNESWHIGIITKVKGNKIYYCDLNSMDGAGFNKSIEFVHYSIKGIYPISFKYWIGNLLDSYIEIEK